MYVGELSALGSAMLWAGSSIVYKTVSGRISAAKLNALRCLFAALFFALIVLATGRLGHFGTVPAKSYAVLIGSVFVGIGLGDTLYFRSMALIGVSKTLPISGSFPLFTLIISLLFLREPLTLAMIIGACLVVGGVYLVALPREAMVDATEPTSAENRLGIMLAIFAAVCWAVSASLLSWGMGSVDLVLANTIRLPVAALFLGLFAVRQSASLATKGLGAGSIGLIAVAGVFGTGVGGLLFLAGIQQAGAAVATTLNSTAPLFAAPLSRVLLKERLSRAVVLGTLLSFLGIVLIVVRNL